MEKEITAKFKFKVKDIKEADLVIRKMLSSLSVAELDMITDTKLSETIMDIPTEVFHEKTQA